MALHLLSTIYLPVLFNLRGSSIDLKQTNTIQKIISFFLIILFALSNTPRIVIHDLLADHKDTYCSGQIAHGASVTKAGINCHFDQFVAESPFVETPSLNTTHAALFFSIAKDDCHCLYYSLSIISYGLRGPPARA